MEQGLLHHQRRFEISDDSWQPFLRRQKILFNLVWKWRDVKKPEPPGKNTSSTIPVFLTTTTFNWPSLSSFPGMLLAVILVLSPVSALMDSELNYVPSSSIEAAVSAAPREAGADSRFVSRPSVTPRPTPENFFGFRRNVSIWWVSLFFYLTFTDPMADLGMLCALSKCFCAVKPLYFDVRLLWTFLHMPNLHDLKWKG